MFNNVQCFESWNEYISQPFRDWLLIIDTVSLTKNQDADNLRVRIVKLADELSPANLYLLHNMNWNSI